MSKARTLAAIVVSGLMVLSGAVVWAQSEGRDSCIDACEENQDECVNRCGAHDNPAECEQQCQDAAEDCIHLCR
jgi:hypothetical protein